MSKWKKLIAYSLGVSSLVTANTLYARDVEENLIDSSPYLITVGDPSNPIYANAGQNLRNGVGSIYIEFANGGFICTATAIGPRHVLTAAHCVRNGSEPVDRLRFILNAGLESPMILEASGFSVHPMYDIYSPSYGAFAHGDIAVIELEDELPPEIETYELYTSADEFDKETRHYGHGRSGKGNKGATGDADFWYARTGLNKYEQVLEPFFGDGIPDQLLHDYDSGGRKHNAMEWWFSSSSRCAPDHPGNPSQAQDGQCTTFKDGSYPDFKGFGKFEVGVAPGDSGGPGFIDNKVAGVHSFGFTHYCGSVTNGTDFSCGLNSSYGEMSGDTRVSFYTTWINDITSGISGVTSIPAVVPETFSSQQSQAVIGQSQRVQYFMSNVFSNTYRESIPKKDKE